jgi:hypothetical protein
VEAVMEMVLEVLVVEEHRLLVDHGQIMAMEQLTLEVEALEALELVQG